MVDAAERERRRAVIEMARATLERTEPDHLAIAMSRPVTDRVAKEIAELEARDRRWAKEREAQATTSQHHLEAWLRSRLDTERAFIVEIVGQALGQALQKERAVAKRELSSEVRSLRLELTEANEVISELRKTLDAGKRSGAIIDLQPVARRN